MKGRPLVAVNEGMIFGDSKSVGGGNFKQVRLWGIEESVLWTPEGGVQQTFIANACGTSKRRQRRRVKVEKSPAADPAWLLHLASARNVSRYLAMNSSPSFICSSTSGS